MDDWKLSAVTVVKLEKELNVLVSLFNLLLGTTEYRGKMAKITAEICESREFHVEITASMVKSEHGYKAPIDNIKR